MSNEREVLELLRRDEAGAAFDMALRATQMGDESLDMLTLLADAAMRVEDFPQAESAVQRALLLDPQSAELRWMQGEILLQTWRIEEALEAFSAMAPPCQASLAFCHELLGHGELAEQAHRRARAEAAVGDEYIHLSPEEFEQIVEQAADQLSEELRESLAHVALIIDPVPNKELLGEDLATMRPDILGLFLGTPLSEVHGEVTGELPARVHLFQRNIERMVTTREGLVEETFITLYHELGHAVGFDEDGVEDMGLG